jgi:hypothetical protein
MKIKLPAFKQGTGCPKITSHFENKKSAWSPKGNFLCLRKRKEGSKHFFLFSKCEVIFGHPVLRITKDKFSAYRNVRTNKLLGYKNTFGSPKRIF